MKKWGLAVFLPMILTLLFALGCSIDNTGAGGGDNVVREGIIPIIPEVRVENDGFQDAEVAEIIRLMPNIVITERNLTEFIDAFAEAMGEFTPEARILRNTGGFSNIKSDTVIYGGISGRITIKEDLYFAWRGNDSGYTTATYEHKYFDYSNVPFLFLGGAVGVLKHWGNDHNKNGITHFVETYRGAINFRGEYQGKVVFDNLVYSIKTRNGEIIESRITGGKFFVESEDDTVKFTKDLDPNLIHKFCYQYKSSNFGTGKDTTGTGGGKDTTGTGGGGMPSETLPNLPSVSGGGISSGLNVSHLPNATVTLNNLSSFLFEMQRALDAEESSRSTRSERPTERWEYSGVWKDNFSYIGRTGRAEVSWNEEWGGIGNDDYYRNVYRGTQTIKFFDYSNNNELFFGGNLAVAELWIDEGNDISEIETEEIQINGTIRFVGRYEGSIVFQNYSHKFRGRYLGWDSETYENIYDTISFTRSGNFYVADRNGNKITDLSPKDVRIFTNVYSQNRDHGNTPTLDRTMPAVPNAPAGRLTNRSGANATVSSTNVNDFFRTLVSEYNNNYSRSIRGAEETYNWEYLEHGRESGYVLEKGNGTYKRNNSGISETWRGTTEFFDFSNNGILYFGGGYGEAGISLRNIDQCCCDSQKEHQMNGRVNFNGDFSGTLSFNNFRYRIERDNWREIHTRISGSVTIGSLDVTDQYVRYVLNGEMIPGGGGINQSAIIGTWIYSESDSWEHLEWYLVFNADGTGTSSFYEYDFSTEEEWWESESFSWNISGNTICMAFDWNSSWCETFSISSNSLFLFDIQFSKVQMVERSAGTVSSSDKSSRFRERFLKNR